jgi:putative radical SAM enzyme (TIGR03279 family)
MRDENLIAAVAPGSIAEELGLCPGDRVLALGGEPVVDALDLAFLDEGSPLLLSVERRSGERIEFEIERDPEEPLGIELRPLRPRGCGNRCIFCFADQNFPEARASLRFKDEDYRFSFLDGNYVTLSHLSPAEERRIVARRLSPLYVSVHAVDDGVRRSLLGQPRARAILPLLRRLVDGGIEFHAQIVLCPGINDGRVLEQTLGALLALHPGVRDVALVPVGLTRHRAGLPRITPPTGAWAREILTLLARFQARARGESGTRFAFAADELYLLAGRAIPPAEEYEGYPQLANGVGLWRSFRDELDELTAAQPPAEPGRRASALLVTGRSAAPLLREAAGRLGVLTGVAVGVVSVDNETYGPQVGVAGLLTGRDIVAALRRHQDHRPAIIPAVTLAGTGDRFLDDLTPDDVAAASGHPVSICEATPEGLRQALDELADRAVPQ